MLDDFDDGPATCSLCGECGWDENNLCRKEHKHLVTLGVLSEDDFQAYNLVKPAAVERLSEHRRRAEALRSNATK
jgi:hypothetical protein